jgi:hypothetical protein
MSMIAPPGPRRMILGTIPLYNAKYLDKTKHYLQLASRICFSYPSSLYTSAIDCRHVLYLTSLGTGCGPWIRLLATSKGMLTTDAIVPPVKPIKNRRIRSWVGSWKRYQKDICYHTLNCRSHLQRGHYSFDIVIEAKINHVPHSMPSKRRS